MGERICAVGGDMLYVGAPPLVAVKGTPPATGAPATVLASSFDLSSVERPPEDTLATVSTWTANEELGASNPTGSVGLDAPDMTPEIASPGVGGANS